MSRNKPKKFKNIPITPKQLTMLKNQDLSQVEFCVFDLETTGGNPERNGITEIAAIKYKNGVPGEKFYSLVNPERRIPPIVRRITKITNEMVKDAPKIQPVMVDFLEFLGDSVLVSHNTVGDVKFLEYFAKTTCDHLLNNFYLCTHLLSEKIIPNSPSMKLTGLAEYLKVDMEGLNAHRADADAEITLKLFETLYNKFSYHNLHSLEDVVRFQGDLESLVRLGWGVSDRFVKSIPKRPGVFTLYRKSQSGKLKPVFVCGCFNLFSHVMRLKNYNKLPKPLLKLALTTNRIEFIETSSYFEALVMEKYFEENHQPRYFSRDWLQRFVNAICLRKVEGGWQVSIARPHSKFDYVFGDLNDVSGVHQFLAKVSKHCQQPYVKKSFQMSEDFGEELLEFLKGNFIQRVGLLKRSKWLNPINLLSPTRRKKITSKVALLEFLAAEWKDWRLQDLNEKIKQIRIDEKDSSKVLSIEGSSLPPDILNPILEKYLDKESLKDGFRQVQPSLMNMLVWWERRGGKQGGPSRRPKPSRNSHG